VTARVLDGSKVAREIREEVAREVEELQGRLGRAPGLTVVQVGEDPASTVYVRNKNRAAEKAGFLSSVRRLPDSVSTAEILSQVEELNADPATDGILVQLPLPGGVESQHILDAIDPDKDVDGFHPRNVGRLVTGRPALVPCTPAGIVELLRRNDIALEGRRAVILGRSNIVGKPMAALLLAAHATVTICHSRTRDLPAVAREADLLVVALGRKGMVTEDYVRPGAVVVDVGIHRVEDEGEALDLFGESPRLEKFREKGHTLVGDVHPRRVRDVAGWLSPVPGGVGPLTVALLLRNTVQAARRGL
jgi:methylenetetrahydrofolate dehydrogenase (NADP+)/methenyltetrahydrofolate cyclohydrolase